MMRNYWAADEEGAIIWRLRPLPSSRHLTLRRFVQLTHSAHTLFASVIFRAAASTERANCRSKQKEPYGEMLFGRRALGSSYIPLALLNISKKQRFAVVQSCRAQNNKSAERGLMRPRRPAGFPKCDCKNRARELECIICKTLAAAPLNQKS